MEAATAPATAAVERDFDLRLAALTLEDEYPDMPADVIAENLASARGDVNAARSSLEELTHAYTDSPTETSKHRNWWPAWPETHPDNGVVVKTQQEPTHVDDEDAAIDSICQALESAFYPLDSYTIRAVLEARRMDVSGTIETLRELLGPEGVVDNELVIAILQNVASKPTTMTLQLHDKAATPDTTSPHCPAPTPVPVPVRTPQLGVCTETPSDSSHALAAAELAEFFPALPQSAVSLALARNGGDVHAASETLLNMNASTPSTTQQEHVVDGSLGVSISAPTSPTPEQDVQCVIRVPTASRSLPPSPQPGRSVIKDGNAGKDVAMPKGFVLGQSNATATPLTFKPSVPVPFRVAAQTGLKHYSLPPPPATSFPPLVVGDTIARPATHARVNALSELVAYVDDQDAGFSTKVGELQEYFPVLPLDVVESALAANHGNIQAASEALAELIDEEGTITHWSEVSKSYVDMARLHQEDADIAAAIAASLTDAESTRVRQYLMKEQARLHAIEEERRRNAYAKDQPQQKNKHVHPKPTMNDFYVWQTVKTRGSSKNNNESDPATALMRKALSPPQEYWRQAGLARQARAAYYQRAQAAYDCGDTALAGQLSAKGREHDERYRELMGLAQQSAFINNNSQLGNLVKLDLHGLTVAEALDTLEKYLDKLSCLGATMTLSVITGVGKHSVKGRARILPSVLNYLKDHQMRWFMPQAGVVNILINQEPPGYT